jgi:two-component system, NtrC family, sensor histidine kinase HydH
MNAAIQDTLGHDVSQLAVAERQRLLSRMLSQLAHEIRNPLGSLDVHVQLLEEDLGRLSPPISSQISGRLGVIRTELQRLDGVVRQFLSLAKPSAVNARQIDIAETLHQVRSLLGAEAAARTIDLVMTVPTTLPPLSADSGQLIQAVVNLVINAIQAVERRGRVEIEARLEQPPEWLCIDVRDTGPGIDVDKGGTIFEPFFTTKAEGSGLGLWIVQQIALAHGGTISATNIPAGGALFTLRLPLQASAATP